MKISVQKNKNVIFFETLISFVHKRTNYHPLGEKIIETFTDIKKLESFKEFCKNVKEKRIPFHPWQYLFLSINLNDNLTPKSLSPIDGFGPKRKEAYVTDIYPLVKKIHTECNFEEKYNQKILAEYEDISNEIQRFLDKSSPGDILKEFWGDELSPKLIFIPNPLRVGGGSSVSRGKEFYSITGTVETDQGIVFKESHMISNLLHEYSHSFFKYYLYKNKTLFKKNEEICEKLSQKVEKDEESQIFKNYGRSVIYFEETFIRAVQILLSKRFFEKRTSEDMESKSLELLKKRKKEGFIYIEGFYKELEQSRNPMDSYFYALQDIANK